MVFTHHACPIYDGLKMAGWAHEEIKLACEGMGQCEIDTMTGAFPELSGSVSFRSTPDAPCVEEFSVEA